MYLHVITKSDSPNYFSINNLCCWCSNEWLTFRWRPFSRLSFEGKVPDSREPRPTSRTRRRTSEPEGNRAEHSSGNNFLTWICFWEVEWNLACPPQMLSEKNLIIIIFFKTYFQYRYQQWFLYSYQSI